MAELRVLLTKSGHQNIRTYIQSGNCVLESGETNPQKIEADIHGAIKSQFGYDVPVIALTDESLKQIIEDTPFTVSEDDEKTVHIFFLSQPAAAADIQKLEFLKAPTETFKLTDTAFYLYAPSGIGRSKLASGAEKCLGVTVTARNLRSAKKVLALATSA